MANCQVLLLFFSINTFQISGKKYIVRTRDGENEVNKETSNQTTGASLKVYVRTTEKVLSFIYQKGGGAHWALM